MLRVLEEILLHKRKRIFNGTNEGDFLPDVQTLSGQLFSESPHLISTQVLILKHEFDVVGLMLRFVDLCIESSHDAPGTM